MATFPFQWGVCLRGVQLLLALMPEFISSFKWVTSYHTSCSDISSNECSYAIILPRMVLTVGTASIWYPGCEKSQCSPKSPSSVIPQKQTKIHPQQLSQTKKQHSFARKLPSKNYKCSSFKWCFHPLSSGVFLQFRCEFGPRPRRCGSSSALRCGRRVYRPWSLVQRQSTWSSRLPPAGTDREAGSI